MELFVNSIKMTEVFRKDWELENNNFIKVIKMPDLINNYYIYTIFIDENDPALAKKPSWLKVNSDYIDFNLSKDNIEKAHLIFDTDVTKEIDNIIAGTKSVKEVKMGHELIKMGCLFDSHDYRKYMNFKFNTNQNIEVVILDDYENNNFHCYSFPFFKSLMVNNNESNPENCKFTFLKILIENKEAIAFKVEFSNGVVKYYDYSQNPPFIPNGKNGFAYYFQSYNFPKNI